MGKKIISGNELSGEEIASIVETALDIKRNPGRYSSRLSGKSFLLLFQKTSTRTRMAFELGMKKLGGNCIVMDWDKSNFSISPLKYEGRYAGSMVDCMLARLIRNEDVRALAEAASVPFINGCCDMYHPSQALADILTIYETRGSFDTTLTYVGVQNNVANSLFYTCLKTGTNLIFVTPMKDKQPEDFELLKEASGTFRETDDLEEALSHTEFLYTDTWINMEHFQKKEVKAENEEKLRIMMKYQVNRKLIEGRAVYIMHDMPLHPGFEIDDYAISCERSLIFQQAKNRMYAGQALLLHLLDAV